MLKKTMFGYGRMESMGPLGETFINRTYLATYICILLFIVLSILLYKTRFGLRLPGVRRKSAGSGFFGDQRL